jgi:hypothetical protein
MSGNSRPAGLRTATQARSSTSAAWMLEPDAYGNRLKRAPQSIRLRHTQISVASALARCFTSCVIIWPRFFPGQMG